MTVQGVQVLTDTRRGVAIFDWGRGDEVINHESILFFSFLVLVFFTETAAPTQMSS